MDWRGTRRSWEDWIDVIDANTPYFHGTALCLNVTNISTIKLQFRDADKQSLKIVSNWKYFIYKNYEMMKPDGW